MNKSVPRPGHVFAPGGAMSLRRGFTLFEVLVVICIIGILLAATFPSILNALHTRSLESAARDIASDLQWAKLQAVKTKLNHRLRFEQLESGVWAIALEREVEPDTWQTMPRYVRKTISPKFNVTVSLPELTVVYSPLGMVDNFSTLMNSVTLQSDRLKASDQFDVRELRVYAGGSVQYVRNKS